MQKGCGGVFCTSRWVWYDLGLVDVRRGGGLGLTLTWGGTEVAGPSFLVTPKKEYIFFHATEPFLSLGLGTEE